MTPENFCYWLQGYFELHGDAVITFRQSKIIQEHLNLVFKKVTAEKMEEPKQAAVSETITDFPVVCGSQYDQHGQKCDRPAGHDRELFPCISSHDLLKEKEFYKKMSQYLTDIGVPGWQFGEFAGTTKIC